MNDMARISLTRLLPVRRGSRRSVRKPILTTAPGAGAERGHVSLPDGTSPKQLGRPYVMTDTARTCVWEKSRELIWALSSLPYPAPVHFPLSMYAGQVDALLTYTHLSGSVPFVGKLHSGT